MMDDKVWILMQTKKSHPFWISDTPVTMHNQNDMTPYGNIGLGVPAFRAIYATNVHSYPGAMVHEPIH